MAFRKRVLVVANRTADSEGLAEALRRQAAEADASFTLLVPATPGGGRTAARRQLNAALELLRGAGLEVDGMVGDPDPVVAVHEIWDPGDYDEVVVSTLSRDSSRWLEIDLPHRIGRMCDVPVQHVVPAEIERALARERMRPEPAPPPQRALGPFVGPAES
jgi:K+-sensing histidine kinase KdpD